MQSQTQARMPELPEKLPYQKAHGNLQDNADIIGIGFCFASGLMSEPTLTPVPDQIVNTQGLYCPEPVMMLHQAVRKSQSGQIIQVLATDPSTTRDIPKFCLHLGHELLQQQQQSQNGQTCYAFWIKKR